MPRPHPSNEAANVAQLGGLIQEIELQPYAQMLRYTVAISVGLSVLLGVL
jgi:hypothetical protein